MTQKETDMKGLEVLRASVTRISDITRMLREVTVHGPLTPALQHLEEAGFWLQKCKMFHIGYLNEMEKAEQEKPKRKRKS